MAKAIIARDAESCKDSAAKFRFELSNDTPHLYAQEIYRSGDKEAMRNLKLLGFDKFVKGTHFVRFDDFVKYYGVTEKYAKTFFRNNGFTTKNFPNDVFTGTTRNLLVTFNYRNARVFNSETLNKPDKFVSARFVLMACALMAGWRCAGFENKVAEAYEFLKRSSYAEKVKSVKELVKEQKRATKEQQESAKVKAAKSLLNSTDKISLTFEQLIELFAVAVRILNKDNAIIPAKA